jgi:hypothetical protein
MAELSGSVWVARFPGTNSVDDLEATFQANVRKFMAALEAGSATLDAVSTYRPPERAYLMHWSWMIVKQGQDPQTVPPMAGVDIQWWHGSQPASLAGAQAMVTGYGIGSLGVAPALSSRHTERKAIDLAVTWDGTLKVKNADGTETSITSTPRDSTNADLIAVGGTYNVVHFLTPANDKNHWSTDGH